MSKINILDLHRRIDCKKQRKVESYDKVLEIFHRRIRRAADNKQVRCVLAVPEFVYGYPIYELNPCIEHLAKSLARNGFVVRYMFPNTLYISWDLDEINAQKRSSAAAAPSKRKLSDAVAPPPMPPMRIKLADKSTTTPVPSPMPMSPMSSGLVTRTRTGKIKLDLS
jgi:hypothetical protein